MANLSSYDSNVILDVPLHDTNIENDISYQSVQKTQCSKQPNFENETETDITSDSNIISYEQYLQETENPVVQSTNSSAQQDELLMSVIEEMSSQVAKCNKVQQENTIVNETLTAELERYKELLKDMKAVFNQMETEVAKYSVDKKYVEIEKKELFLENDRLLEHIICQDVINVVIHANTHNMLYVNNNRLDNDNLALEPLKMENDRLMKLLISQDLVHTLVNTLAAINDYKSMQQSFVDEYEENLKLQTKLAKKSNMVEKAVYNELSNQCSKLENWCISLEIKLQQRKESFQNNKPPLNQNAPEFQEFFQINELQAYLEAKNVLIAKLKEHVVNIKGKNVVESVQSVHNLNVVTSNVYKVDLQPLSRCKKNKRDAHIDYFMVTQEHTNTLRGIVKQARALKPLDNLLDYAYKITQTSSSNKKKNKVEDHPRIAKSRLNHMNRVSKPDCNENFKHSMLNANSKLICVTCNKCMFDDIHDLCVRDHLNNVNARDKSKSVKSRFAKSKKKKMWKPTGKVYTDVGYRWKPTGRIFTIDGNTCP
ncbi:hypothetical protein Tco_0245277 [Tanacetum coccineum]